MKNKSYLFLNEINQNIKQIRNNKDFNNKASNPTFFKF